MRFAVSHASVGDSDMPIRVGANGTGQSNSVQIVAGRLLPDQHGRTIRSSLMALNRAKDFCRHHVKLPASFPMGIWIMISYGPSHADMEDQGERQNPTAIFWNLLL